jgi:hypothetical protein
MNTISVSLRERLASCTRTSAGQHRQPRLPEAQAAQLRLLDAGRPRKPAAADAGADARAALLVEKLLEERRVVINEPSART